MEDSFFFRFKYVFFLFEFSLFSSYCLFSFNNIIFFYLAILFIKYIYIYISFDICKCEYGTWGYKICW